MTGYHLAVVCDTTGVFGGAERILEVLLGALPSDVRVTVIGRDEPVVVRLATARSACAAMLPAWTVGELCRALRKIRPDIIHVNLPGFTSCRPAVLAGLSLRIPVVLVDHLPTPGLRLWGRMVQQFMTALCAERVSIGQRTSRLVEKWGGLPHNSITTIYNGMPSLDLSRPEPVPGRLRVAAIGRLVAEKGIDVLLRAMAHTPEITAVVAGTGPEEENLRRLATELDLRHRVEFLGWADPVTVMQLVDAIVLPSRREGLPVVLLEAMHAGVAVVTSDVGSMGEAVQHGRSGLLVEPDNPRALAHSLRMLSRSPHLRSSLSAAARERARRMFSDSVMAREYDRLYRAALMSRPGRTPGAWSLVRSFPL